MKFISTWAAKRRAIRRFPIRMIYFIMSPMPIIVLGVCLQLLLSSYKEDILSWLGTLSVGGEFFKSHKTYVGLSLNAIPTLLVGIFTGLSFFLGEIRMYRKALYVFSSISVIAKMFASNQLKAVLHAEKELTLRKGLAHTLAALPIEAGAELTPGQFAGLCGVVASFYPDCIVGVWNTLWYPLSQVYEADGYGFRTMTTWLPYFGELEKAYDKHTDENNNYRILVVEDNFNWSQLRLQPIWNYLFKEQRRNKVYDVFLVRTSDYTRRMHDNSLHAPELGDIAVFQLNGPLGGQSWLIGTKMEQGKILDANMNPIIGRTRLIDDKKDVSKILDLLKDLQSEPNTIHAHFNIQKGRWVFSQGQKTLPGLSTNLASKWGIVSDAYHNDTEVEILSQVLTEYKNKLIHDSACGAGYHAILLAQYGWKNISVSDGDPDNFEVLERRMKDKGVQLAYKHAKFTELKDAGITNCEVIICLGSSLTYCDSWEERITTVEGMNMGVSEALDGLKAALAPSGLLIIGNSKLYQKSKDSDSLNFPPTQLDGKTYKVKWQLTYDWSQFIKRWHCEITDEVNDIETINIYSHLFDEETLKDLCKDLFSQPPLVVDTPGDCPEYYILCSDSQMTLEAAKKNVSTHT